MSKASDLARFGVVQSGGIVKVETQPITAFGDTDGNDIINGGAWVDVAGTEKAFTRSISTSKILVQYNLKLNSNRTIAFRLNRKIGSGAYAVVNNGASGTDGGRTSERGVLGGYYNLTSVNAMAYGMHADLYSFLDESGEGLTNSTDAITYKITLGGLGGSYDAFLNISAYDGTYYNSTAESSVTFMEIKI